MTNQHGTEALIEAQQPTTHVQNSAEIEHVAGDVSKNGAESDMAQQPAPSAAAAGQRRSDLVPGVMHCAKCKFQLNRVTLCVSDGNAYAGNNETEPCPNGCGPLWPVTWEQEARNCWKALEEMHERLHPAPTPQADSQPAPEYVGNGMFKGETIEKAAEHWANWCDRRCMNGLAEFLRVVAAHALADSVTAPAGFVPVAAFDRLHAHAESLAARLLAAPQQAAQEPHGWLYEWTHSNATGKPDATYTAFTTDEAHARKHDNCRAVCTKSQQETDSVTAPAGPSKSLPYEPTSAMLIAARERDPALPIETVRAIYWSMWRTAPTQPATPSAASIAWTALRDLTDPLGEAGVKIMGHVRIYAQRQYEAGLAARAPADSVLEDADPLQGAANWLAEAHGQFCVAVLQGCLMIGYNRAKRLHDAALAARKQGGAT